MSRIMEWIQSDGLTDYETALSVMEARVADIRAGRADEAALLIVKLCEVLYATAPALIWALAIAGAQTHQAAAAALGQPRAQERGERGDVGVR